MSPSTSSAELVRVGELLDGIEKGRVVVPDFQRPFEWSEDEVKALLATVLAGWPAGSLLVHRDRTMFNYRAFDGAPAVSEPDIFVLDGQQRLTALYHAFYDRGPFIYCLDVSEDVTRDDIDSLDQMIRAIPRDRRFRTRGHAAIYRNRSLLPLAVLRDPSEFFLWRDDTLESLPLAEQEDQSERLTQYLNLLSRGISDYEFPVVTLTSELEPASVARIFERLNRSGKRLGAFDLVVAMSYDRDWSVREEWDKARARMPALDRYFDDDGLVVLQTIALAESQDVRTTAVLRLRPSVVRRSWERACEAMNRAIQILHDDCGVVSSAWLPYGNLPVALAALIYREPLLSLADGRVMRWFWRTGFGRRYDVASNTRVVADYLVLLEGRTARDDHRPLPLGSLVEATRRGYGAVWRTFMCALVSNGARDLLTGEVLYSEPAEAEVGDVLPQSLFTAARPSRAYPAPAERVLGDVLARRGSVRFFRTGPWVAEERLMADPISMRGGGTQFLPETSSFAEIVEDWRGTLEYRLSALRKFLNGRGVGVE